VNVLSIQSHVSWGHVGNRSAVFPLERLGIEVWPINTVQFSCNTGIPGWTGTVFPAAHIADIVGGLAGINIFPSCDAVLSGYMGDAGTGAAILDAVDAVKKANPAALYCCDPVMGDLPEGFYVRRELPGLMVRDAVPRADIVTPNLFEAEILSGVTIDRMEDACRAAEAIHELGPRIVVITSFRLPADEDTTDGETGFFLSDSGSCHVLKTPLLAFSKAPKGAGDLFSALFLGNYLLGARKSPVAALEAAASSLYGILEATQAGGKAELAIVAAQDAISAPGRRFKARRLEMQP
jgi:pyridoxine kinase